MSEETYTVDMTGEQAHMLAKMLSMLAQQVEGESTEFRDGVAELAPVGKQCAEIAEKADQWEK